jgi:hypothetical protein
LEGNISVTLRAASLAVVAFSILLALQALATAKTEVLPQPSPSVLDSSVRDKNFYFLELLESPPARAALQVEPSLVELSRTYRARLVAAQESCARRAACYIEAARLTETDIAAAESALRGLYSRQEVIRKAAGDLRRSGTMVRSHDRPDAQLIVDAWRLCAAIINRILATYGSGIEPRFAKIDSMSHDPQSEEFGGLLRTANRVVLATDVKQKLFFSDAVRFSLLVLAADGRDEAGRLEPLERGENLAAIGQVDHTDWKGYPHSIILVPGQGPDDPGVRLSAGGRLRLELAVARYRQHAAPFILVSGGYVHPARTPFNEAMEMKRALIEDYNVPTTAIIVDPHARHTTTNLRNAARIMYRYGFPFATPGLVVTDEYQADYIMSDAFDDRNLRETSTVPYKSKKRISPVEIEFVPSVDALQVSGEDPLDP